MNVLFFTLLDYSSLDERYIYTDLLREFIKNGHKVYSISPLERKKRENTHLIRAGSSVILKLKIGNIQKTNIIEKGISTITIESVFIAGIKKYFSNIKFDLVMYSTPPITFCNAIEYVKERDNAKTYLLLKDIFPQNSVDIGMLRKTGIKGLIYKYFYNKEKKLYAISDYIGCMSKANVDFVVKYNPEVNPEIVEVCPNSVDPIDKSCSDYERISIRKKYGIPLDKKVFVYGGNLGKPQGINFLMKCLYSQRRNQNVFFLIVGNGTEYGKLRAYMDKYIPENVKLMKSLPKEDYDTLVGACDVGLIFLDHRFTIPNFPSRLLSYMQAKIPVLACTDPNTDIGEVIKDGGFGWWCESNDVNSFNKIIKEAKQADLKALGENGYKYMTHNYCVSQSYEIIMKHFEEKQ